MKFLVMIFIICYSSLTMAVQREAIIKDKLKGESSNIVQDSCDQLFFKNGRIKYVKINRITSREILYTACEKNISVLKSIRKKALLKVRYVNGKEEEFTTASPKTDEIPKIENRLDEKEAKNPVDPIDPPSIFEKGDVTISWAVIIGMVVGFALGLFGLLFVLLYFKKKEKIGQFVGGWALGFLFWIIIYVNQRR